MEKKERIYLWDNLRFLLITLVVLGHFIEQYEGSTIFKSIFIFIYAFHMPLFIFISGLFHKNENVAPKVATYLIFGYLYKIIIFAVRSLLGQNPNFYLLKEDGIPWYMFVLAAYILITYLLREVNPRLVLIISVILACFAGYDSSIGDFLVLSRIIVFYPFYVMGTLADKEKLLVFSKRPSRKIVGGIILTAWGVLCFTALDSIYALRPLFTGRNPFNETLYNGGCIFRLFCFILAITLGLALICVIPSANLSSISILGKRSLQVYFWHRPVIYILEALNFSDTLCVSFVGKLIYLCCAVILTLLLSTKLFSFPTSQILRYRDRKTE